MKRWYIVQDQEERGVEREEAWGGNGLINKRILYREVECTQSLCCLFIHSYISWFSHSFFQPSVLYLFIRLLKWVIIEWGVDIEILIYKRGLSFRGINYRFPWYISGLIELILPTLMWLRSSMILHVDGDDKRKLVRDPKRIGQFLFKDTTMTNKR